MNQGMPPISTDPIISVIFPITTDILFDEQINAWLSDNPEYHEIMRSLNVYVSRSATFKNSSQVNAIDAKVFY